MILELLTNLEYENLFLNKSIYPKCSLREPWENINESDKIRWQESAKKFKDTTEEWKILSATKFMLYKRTGDRAEYESQLFYRRNALTALLLSECIENKGEYINDILNALLSICEETYWGLPAHNYSPDPIYDNSNPYIDLYCAETAVLLAYTIYLIGEKIESISHHILKRVKIELKNRVILPFLERTDYWWMGYDTKKSNNWAPWIISNVLTVFLLSDESDKTKYECVKKSGEILDHFLSSYKSDGGCDEGAGYWNEAGGALFDCLDLLFTCSNGKINLFNLSKIAEIGKYIYRANISENYYFNYADCSARPEVDYEMAFRFGKKINDEIMQSFAASHFILERQQGFFKERSIRRELPILFNNDICNFKSKDSVSDCHYFDGLNILCVRQTKSENKGFYFSLKGGHNDESHNHNDVGTFIIYYNGLPLIIDVGVETYRRETFSDKRYTIWTMQSKFHNLPEINGYGEQNGKDFKAENCVFNTGDNPSLTLEIQNAYPKEAKLEKYSRTGGIIRKENKCVVKDEIKFLNNNNEISFTFMTANPPIISGDEITFFSAKQDKIKMLSNVKFDSEVEKINITDKRLLSVWGDSVYKVTLKKKVLEKDFSPQFEFLA